MIERLDKGQLVTLDFLQDVANKKIIDKINEIIDYLNSKEE